MASIIRIKRSEVSGNPSTLSTGELAYSALPDNGANGGDRLYIGMGVETAGNAASHIVIGGKFFTDRLDHAAGTLTANSAIVVDADSKIDNLKVDNLDFNGNSIISTNTNGNIIITPNGTGSIVLDGQNWPQADGQANQILTTNGSGQLSWQNPSSSSFTITGNTGSDTFNTGGTLQFDGTGAISTAVTNDTVTFSVADATASTKGVASFSSTDFTVTSGAVSLNSESIQDIVGAMVSTNTESGISVTYDDTNGKLDFNVNDPVITIAGDVDGSATMTDLGNTTITVTLDTVLDGTTDKVPGTYGSSSAIPVITFDAKGRATTVTTASISTSFSLAADSGTTDTFNNGGTLTFEGGEGIDTTVSNDKITIAAEIASSSNLGVATFNTASFAVSVGGDVTIKTGGVSNTQLANSSVTVGSTSIALGATSTSLAGLTELTVDNININGNEISSTDTNGNISLNPNGSGAVDVNGAVIANVGIPVLSTDAANKGYVDNAVTGLTWKTAVNLLATSNVPLTGNTNTVTIDSHATLTSVHSGYRLLLTGQSTGSQNGIYDYTDNGTTYTLTRSSDADVYTELEGASVYVLEGTQYGKTGWVQTNHYLTDFSGQTWIQFSGAGAYTDGDGLLLTGTTFSVRVAANGGIEISSDFLQLKSSVGGDGLTLTNGVLAVGGTTDRISVSTDAIDISANYVGQTSITTLGTISTGTWNADTISIAKGGTNITTYATGDLLYASAANTLSKLTIGTEGKVLQVNSSGVPVWGDIDGGTY